MDEKPEYRIGDLVWHRETKNGRVWWPAMVTYDPHLGLYFRNVNKSIQYHVQFFGVSPVRGWASSKALKVLSSADEVPLPERGLSKKLSKEHSVAIAEVKEALKVDHKQRKLQFIFNFGTDDRQPEEPQVTEKKETAKVSQRKRSRGEEAPVKVAAKQPKISGGSSKEMKDKESTLPHSIESIVRQPHVPNQQKKVPCQQIKAPCPPSQQLDASCPPLRPLDVPRPPIQPLEMPRPPLQLSEMPRPPRQPLEMPCPPFHSLEMPGPPPQPLEMPRPPTVMYQPPVSPPVPVVPLFQIGSPPLVPLQSFPFSPPRPGGAMIPMDYYSTIMPYRFDPLGGMSYYSSSYLMPRPLQPSLMPQLPLPLSLPSVPPPPPDVGPPPVKLLSPVKQEPLPPPPPPPPSYDPPPVDKKVSENQSMLLTPPCSGSEELTDTETLEPPPSAENKTCAICDLGGSDLLVCEGHCSHRFHLDCLGLMVSPPKPFVCDECLTDTGKCFLCSESGDLVKCCKAKCSKLYHIDCCKTNKLFVFNERKNKVTCPLHVCGRCANIKPDQASTGGLVQCTRCPLALHRSDCLVAGCELISPTLMVCYQHLRVTKNARLYSHINLNTCMECGMIGSLYCCDVCSSAYHLECLDSDDRPRPDQDTWKCPSCAVHDLSTYGALVLCKFGMWRWWPAVVVEPEKVPDNIEARSAGECMFVVRFCGTKDYTWMHHGRAVPYTGITNASRGSSSKQKAFKKALEEAQELYQAQKQRNEDREARKKPDSKRYIKIKANKYLVPRPSVKESSLLFLPCQCTSDQPCNDDSSCVNRASLIECDPQTCPVGPLCKNQRLTTCQEAKTTPFHTGERGWGLRVDQDLAVGDFVVEYIGEILDTNMCRERLEQYHKNNIVNYYMLTLDGGLVIDASQKSNHARFINHSCTPNCESQKWTVNGETRIGIFACVKIKAGTELTFDYHLDSLGNEKKQCLCGSKNCSGFMGLKSVKLAPPEKPKKPVKRKRSKRKRKVIKNDTHEDDCFVCGDGGELLMCDASLCSKSYHIECAQLEALPPESAVWKCPYHFCNECGEEATVFCSTCPTSYCKMHSEGKLEDAVCLLKCVSKTPLPNNTTCTETMDQSTLAASVC